MRLSPHLSASEPTLRARLADGFIENLRRYLRGEAPLNEVDRARGY